MIKFRRLSSENKADTGRNKTEVQQSEDIRATRYYGKVNIELGIAKR